MLATDHLREQPLWIDGFNVLTTLEVALSGGVTLIGRDGALRDIAGVHGSYRSVEETLPALGLIATAASALGVSRCTFLLDRPVSNSGRLSARIVQEAARNGWPFDAQVVCDPDPLLARERAPVASSDGEILDRCAGWFNLARYCVQSLPKAWVLDRSGD